MGKLKGKGANLNMRWNKLYVVVLLLLVVGYSKAQNTQLTFNHLTETNGLTSADYYHLSQDATGLTWIGTDEGLLAFDGQQIKRYQHDQYDPNSLLENKVTSKCFEDQSGNLWFTTENAVNYYVRKSDDFKVFRDPQLLKNYHGFYLDNNSNKFWIRIGTGDRCARYFFDIQTKEYAQSGPLVEGFNAVVKNKDGSVGKILSTFIPDQTGFVWKDLKTGIDRKIEFQYSTEGKKRNFPSPTKSSLIDTDGTVWIGVYNGLGKYHWKDSIGLIEMRRSGTIDSDVGWISDVVRLDDDKLLLAASKGLLVFDLSSQKMVHQFRSGLAESNGNTVKQPNALFIDASNTLWIGGPLREIAFTNLSKNRFPFISKTNGQLVTALAEAPDGNIWCSTLDSGTYVFNQNKDLLFRSTALRNFSSQKNHSDLTPLDFFLKSKKQEWWANLGNTYLFWNPSSKEFEFRLPYFFGITSKAGNRINYNLQRSNGDILLAKGSTIYELYLSVEKADTIPWFNIQYLNLDEINLIFEDQNRCIYVGDVQGRLVILKEQNDQLKKLADLDNLGVIHALKNDPKGNTVWLAGSKGLASIDPDSFDYELLDITLGQFPNEIFYNIAFDKKGCLWLPGNNGLVRYNPESNAFQRFGIKDGLLSSVFNKNTCITASRTKEIWLGGKKGLNVFNPEEIKLLKIKPSVMISRFLVNDEDYKLETNINESKHLRLEYNQNTLSFEFVALDYSDPSSNAFTVQMEGYDAAPIENGNRNFIRYGNLPAGNYNFKVWARNSDGILNEVPFTLPIKIIPPFYQTWWFYLICLLTIVGIIYGVFQYKLEQALKVERLRVKISSDLHDDVGGILSGLAMQTEFLELTANEVTKPKLKRISDLSRTAMSRMRDTVWAIDARKDKMENLIDRMHEHAEETLGTKNFHYGIKVKNIEMKTSIPTDVRQNIYLIYKEAITNVAKHSNGDTVKIILLNDSNNFKMTIHDNGQPDEKKIQNDGTRSK